ncbi:MAG: hypothetical protein GY774_36865 [Planctomycetes bacterium]|nr:hypothetical protein [Planctomycetota bacterium]
MQFEVGGYPMPVVSGMCLLSTAEDQQRNVVGLCDAGCELSDCGKDMLSQFYG